MFQSKQKQQTSEKDMNQEQPINIFYDASCAVCAQEMQIFKRCDQYDQLRLIDCSTPDFSATQYHAEITQQQMMQALHLQRADGSWLKGAEAVAFIYRLMGFTRMANVWQWSWMRKAYPWLAKHRQGLSRLGLDKIWSMLLKRSAQRLQARMQACHQGQCDV